MDSSRKGKPSKFPRCVAVEGELKSLHAKMVEDIYNARDQVWFRERNITQTRRTKQHIKMVIRMGSKVRGTIIVRGRKKEGQCGEPKKAWSPGQEVNNKTEHRERHY